MLCNDYNSSMAFKLQRCPRSSGNAPCNASRGYQKSVASQPIAAEVSDDLPPVRRSPRLIRAAADCSPRVPDNLPPLGRSPRLVEKRLIKQVPESPKRQDQKLAFGDWGVRKVHTSIARTLL
ncbi:hypothetical protein SLEP1_g47268 [Rubroshorea leprosula]|uniref:Uncharacterized protein n=1 Tax=Rubroshorea leprosula TaxID=152421 RepID=A0AAV5LQT9_9ROSI|nr:hypothetical protein SLEP1_g47268 [Rubroshorea leprosula]